LLYTRLPGRFGPLKAVVLSSVWFVAAAAVELGSRWAGRGTGRAWSFPGFQLLLFTSVLSVAYDYRTMKAAGGTWADLQALYGVERTRNLVAVAVPAALAVLAIAQQLVSGTGLDFVRGIVENVPPIAHL
jgi:hypothetical protein